MGFRCPKCGEEFGLDQEKLNEHFGKNPECRRFALRTYCHKMDKTIEEEYYDPLEQNLFDYE